MAFNQTIRRPSAPLGILSTNKVLQKTYALLGATALFSALTAGAAMVFNAAPMNPLFMLIGYFGLLFLTSSLRNSVWGLVSIFAFTGFMGYSIGPVLNFYIKAFTNGNQLVMTAFGATGLIFFGLSAYALTTRKNFNYLAAFLSTVTIVAFIASLASVFLHMPLLNLFVSGAFALVSAGYILFQTSLIINGGETNYIMATITLYVSLLNLFLSLLQILAAFSGERR